MPSINKVLLIGHLGKDPETKYLPSGGQVCKFSMATTEKWKDKSSGEWKELVTWHNIIVYGKLAEVCEEYLKKGALVYVEGKMRNRSWEDKDGNKKYISEIIINSMQMLDRKKSEGSSNGEEGPAGDEDVPF